MKRYVYAALFVVAGAVAIFMAFYVGGEIREKRDWPTVPGKLLEPAVGMKYQYDVGGKHYINDQVYLIATDEDASKKLVEGMPVHYNPKNPGDSFLFVNETKPKWLLVGAGALALLMGLAQLLVARKARKQT